MTLSLAKISIREKIFLFAGGAIVVSILLYLFVFDPIRERAILLSRLIPQKENELNAFSALQEEHSFLSAQMKQVEGRLPEKNRFSPLSYIEAIAKENDVRGNIAYIRSVAAIVREPYREIPVEVKVEDISLDRAVAFLDAIEHSVYFLRIKRLNIRTRASDSNQLDMTFAVSSYEKL
jgi:hypothetical protein